MTQMPCYNSIAADRYDRQCCDEEAQLMAIQKEVDCLMDALSIGDLRHEAKPHEQEMIDELLDRIAEARLKEAADDNFIEPEPYWM